MPMEGRRDGRARGNRGVWTCLRIDLRSKWRAWVVLALLISLFGGTALAAASGARRTDTAYPRLRQWGGSPDLLIVPANSGLNGYYHALGQLRQVASLRTIFLYQMGLPTGGSAPDMNIQVESADDARSGYLNRVKILQGRMFDPRDPKAVIIDEQLAQQRNLRPGGTLHLVGEPNDGDGTTDPTTARALSFRVAAIAAFDDQVVAPNHQDSLPRILLTPAFAKLPSTTPLRGSDGGAVSLVSGSNRAAFIREAKHLATEPAYLQSTGGQVFVGDLDAQGAAVEHSIQPEAISLAIFATLVGLMTLIVIVQLLGRQLSVDGTDNPVLGAVGMTRRDLIVLSLLRASVITGVGAIGAVAVAILASPLMPIGPARAAEPSPGVEVNVALLVVGLVVGAVLPVLLLIPRARRAARMTPPSGSPVSGSPEHGVRPPLDLIGSVPASVGVRMALDSGRGRRVIPVRSALVGVAISLAAIVAALIFGTSLSRLVGTPSQYGQSWQRTVDLGFGGASKQFVDAVMKGQPGVASYAVGDYSPFGGVSINSTQVPAIGIKASSSNPFLTLLSGRLPRSADEVVLGARTLRQVGGRVGGSVNVAISGAPRPMRIVGEAVFPSFSRGSFDATDLGTGAAFTADTLSVPFGQTACTVGETCYNFVLVKYHPGADMTRADVSLAHAVTEAGCPVGSCTIVAGQRPVGIEDYARVRQTPAVLAGTLALLGAAMFTLVLVTGVRRRRRDLAILKSLGFRRRQLLATVQWNALTIASIALIFGIPFGIVVGRLAWTTFATSLGVPNGADVPLLEVLVVIPVALLLAVVAAAGPGWSASQVRVADVLADE